MANDVAAGIAEYWSRRMQRRHEKIAVFRAIANFEEASLLKKGDVVHRPYRSQLYAATYTRGTAFTVQDLTDTDEYLTVDTAKIVPFYVDDLDALQNNHKIMNKYADDAMTVLNNEIDGTVLGEYDQADSNVSLCDGEAHVKCCLLKPVKSCLCVTGGAFEYQVSCDYWVII